MYTCAGGSCRARVLIRLSKRFTSPCVAEEELCHLDQENQPASDPLAGCGYSPINIEHVSRTPTDWMDPISIERCSNSTSTSSSSYEPHEDVEDGQLELDVLCIGNVYPIIRDCIEFDTRMRNS